jgi:hypothetical protein
MVVPATHMEGKEKLIQNFQFENLKRRNPLEGLMSREENNIKMSFKEVGRGAVDRVHLTQDRDMRRGPVNAGK